MYVSLEGKPQLFVSRGIADILGICELSIYIEAVHLKTFLPFTLNYASTANIEEVMKFYNLGNKSLETDFRSVVRIYL